MDWGPLIGPAVVAAGVSGIVSVIGLIVSTRTAHAIHTEKLDFDRDQAAQKLAFDERLADNKFSYDRELAERKFAQEREQLVYKRQFELAEGILADAYRFRGLIRDARISGSFGGEGTTRKSEREESDHVKQMKDMYYIPIERLRRDGEFLAGFFAKQFTATAQFGPKAKESFNIFMEVTNNIHIASGMLITMVDQPSVSDQKVHDQLLDDLWTGRAQAFGRDDKIEARIEQAVKNLEDICRPILEMTAA
jgi:hypothetical protein